MGSRPATVLSVVTTAPHCEGPKPWRPLAVERAVLLRGPGDLEVDFWPLTTVGHSCL